MLIVLQASRRVTWFVLGASDVIRILTELEISDGIFKDPSALHFCNIALGDLHLRREHDDHLTTSIHIDRHIEGEVERARLVYERGIDILGFWVADCRGRAHA